MYSWCCRAAASSLCGAWTCCLSSSVGWVLLPKYHRFTVREKRRPKKEKRTKDLKGWGRSFFVHTNQLLGCLVVLLFTGCCFVPMGSDDFAESPRALSLCSRLFLAFGGLLSWWVLVGFAVGMVGSLLLRMGEAKAGSR